MKRSAIAHLALLPVMAMATACPPLDGSVAPSVLATGTTPNAVAVVRCEAGPRLLVTASAEGRLDVLDPGGISPPSSIFLGVGTQPWDVAVVRHATDVNNATSAGDEASRAVVTLAGTHGVAVVRPCGGAGDDVDDDDLLHIATDLEPFDLASPVTLRQPEDVDGDGIDDDVVTRMTPRTPQAVAVTGTAGDGVVVVAFANLLAFATGPDEPMLAGPGLVSTFDLADDILVPRGRAVLPCENPGGMATDGRDAVIVACAGRYAVSATGHDKASAGAVVTLDGQGLVVATSTALSTPGPVVLHGGFVVSADLLDGSLQRLDPLSLAISATITGRSDVIDSAFALTVDDNGALVAGWFDGRVQRDPFVNGTVVPAPAGPGRGLVDLVHDGDRLWGLHTLAAELVVIGAGP